MNISLHRVKRVECLPVLKLKGPGTYFRSLRITDSEGVHEIDLYADEVEELAIRLPDDKGVTLVH